LIYAAKGTEDLPYFMFNPKTGAIKELGVCRPGIIVDSEIHNKVLYSLYADGVISTYSSKTGMTYIFIYKWNQIKALLWATSNLEPWNSIHRALIKEITDYY
jgi:hypothetical protein